ncbi:MAG: glycine cleavage system protein H [Gemmatimonadetes bacterium]|nr:glycine cleavage system protein H [Gemmatimonadota bacterium]
MEGLGPVDMFATKGAEYLIALVFLVLLAGYWRLLSRPAPAAARATATPRAGASRPGWFELRPGFYFHPGHAWAAPEDGDVVRVGMDDFAHKLLGQPAAIELPPVGSRVRPGEREWAVTVDSRSVGMLSPVEGEVVGVNTEAIESPELVTRDPYGQGWLLEVKVPHAPATFKNLLAGPLARAWMEGTVERLRQMRAPELGIVLPDGGFPVAGFARILAPERWDQVAREFLLSD